MEKIECPVCGSIYIDGKWKANTNKQRHIEERLEALQEKLDNLTKESEIKSESENTDHERDWWTED